MLQNEQEKMDNFLKLLEKSGVERYIKKLKDPKEEDQCPIHATSYQLSYIVLHLKKVH